MMRLPQKFGSRLLRKCSSSHLNVSRGIHFHTRALVTPVNKSDSSSASWNVLASAILLSVAASTSAVVAYSEDHELPPIAVSLRTNIRRDEVKQHISEANGIWVTHNDGVFDLSSFIANHPGGRDKILLAAGKDLSELWKLPEYQLHYRSPLVFELLEEHRIGTLHPDDVQMDNFKHSWGGSHRGEKVYSNDKIYECIIVGSGLSGLQCANTLLDNCSDSISNKDILILEASDYIGGRVKQIDSFVAGIPIDVGAEFLHGANTLLARNAIENGDELKELFCWAQGDGGPLPEAAENGGFGLYYLGGDGGKGKERLLRFDDKDEDFVRMNSTLAGISSLDTEHFTDNLCVHDYLASLNFSDEMMSMAEAGFSNTMCTNSRDLSLRQSVRWGKFWDEEEGDDGDFVFVNSFRNLIKRLHTGIQVELNTPVVNIQHPKSGDDIGLVKLTAADGSVYYAKNVVITASPPVIASKITFQPPLSGAIDEALDSVFMHDVVKIFLKFSEPVWPKDLHGVIMAGKTDFLVPEVWFKDIDPKKVHPSEQARALAVCYTTSDYAKKLSKLPKEEVLKQVLSQLDQVFSNLEDRHMTSHSSASTAVVDSAARRKLKKPSEAYLGGMFWDWNAQHYPYITGGYCSSRAGRNAESIKLMAEPYSHEDTTKADPPVATKRLYFAGEATSETAGATAHAALGSGQRAGLQVAKSVQAEKNAIKQ